MKLVVHLTINVHKRLNKKENLSSSFHEEVITGTKKYNSWSICKFHKELFFPKGVECIINVIIPRFENYTKISGKSVNNQLKLAAEKSKSLASDMQYVTHVEILDNEGKFHSWNELDKDEVNCIIKKVFIKFVK